MPIELNPLTKALFNDGQSEPGVESVVRPRNTSAGIHELQPKQDQKYAQTSISTPTSSVRTVRILVNSSGQIIRSAGSSANPPKRSGADSNASTPENPPTVGRADAAESGGSVYRYDSWSGKGEDIELRSTTRLKRAAKVSGGLLSGPARRGRRRQTEEDAEAQGEEPLAADHDPESQQAQDVQPNDPESYNEAAPHHELIPQLQIPSVHDKPARPPSLDTGSVAPQQARVSPERIAFAVESQNAPSRPDPPPPRPKMSILETVTATQANKKKVFMLRVNGRVYTRIDCLGRGGSGKVYRVATTSGVMLAFKRVSLEHADEVAEKALRGEIELLKRLRGVDRVIQLIDYEMNREKQSLSIVSIFVFPKTFSRPYSSSQKTRDS